MPDFRLTLTHLSRSTARRSIVLILLSTTRSTRRRDCASRHR